MRRRALLVAVSSLSIGVGLAGCSVGSDPEERTELDVMSTSDEPHTVDVTVVGEEGVLFEERYELGAGKGNTSASVEGAPAEVRVDVADGASEQFEYSPPMDCERADDDPKIVLTVWSADEVGLSYGCAW